MKRLFKPPLLIQWYFHRRQWRSKDNKVYLTFDDGPSPNLTDQLLSILRAEDVSATFFCVGENARKYPELIEKIKSHGHAIGNHTMRHERGTKVKMNDYLSSIREASQYIDSKLFRPPYGRMPSRTAWRVARDYKVIMWSWLSYDFDVEIPISEILKKARKQLKGGEVLVLHDNEKVHDRVVQLLPELIKEIRKKGLDFEVISA